MAFYRKSLQRRHFGLVALLVLPALGVIAPAWFSTAAALAETSGPGLSVVSLNLAMQTNPDVILRELDRSPALRNADVFLLQEVIHPGGDKRSVADRMAEKLGLHVIYGPSVEAATINALAILSRYPISEPCLRPLRTFNLHVRSRSRVALGATIRSPFGAVRIYNVHLDTRINAAERTAQLEPIVDEALSYKAAVIGGDFNTNNHRWLGHLVPIPYGQIQTAAVQRLMRRKGFSSPFENAGATHDFFGMRLDWLFLSGMKHRAQGIQPMQFSDHHALWTLVVPDPRKPD